MSQQGEKPAANEDDWWRRLYDETAPDTGPSSAPDSLDDRFDSASDAVGRAPDPLDRPVTMVPVPDPRTPGAEPVRGTPGGVPGGVPTAPVKPPAPLAPQGRPAPERPRTPEQLPAPPVRSTPEPPAVTPEPTPAPPEPPAPPAPPAPSAPERPPAPAPPRTLAVPAPWEPPVGPARPRTFAAPPAPEPPGPVTAPADPSGAAHAPGADAPGEEPPRPVVGHLGDRPPTYDAESAALPASGPDDIGGLVADTVLDGARYGTYTLRAASVRGDSARFRGEPRRDALLTARFGTGDDALVLVAVAGGARAAEHAHLAAADACRWIGAAVARSHARLSDDIRAGRRGDLRSGLQRLTDRTYGKLRARAVGLGLEPSAYTVGLRCLLLSADPECRTRVFFGIGAGGLFRLRDGAWQDLEPLVPAPSGGSVGEEGPGGDRLTMDLHTTTPPAPYAESPAPPPAEPFRFRASVARAGDVLVLCGNGLAEPMRGEPALAEELARRWAAGPPGLPAYLADTQLRVTGYADDRTSAAVWEA
ncbi:protein phosphatase 2C domain-containing protein [Streptomyces sp. NBC_01102]|uniref:protein phosphatase 2C domain-containing protein n=1 Tax=Streptomyces sp. NBC_01102 TaxID=2903749 RepID=UPI0038693667|nr:protein phosphatase 2C domain-containing protein [Streptomyces sp. NBC_01102]